VSITDAANKFHEQQHRSATTRQAYQEAEIGNNLRPSTIKHAPVKRIPTANAMPSMSGIPAIRIITFFIMKIMMSNTSLAGQGLLPAGRKKHGISLQQL
jgi:hypothetical protein